MSFRVQKPNLRGSKNPASKLTEGQVAEIRMSDKSSYILAKLYGVNRRTIGRIKTGETWAAVMCAWVLWQGGNTWVGQGGPLMLSTIVDTYVYRYQCIEAMNKLRYQRTPLLLKKSQGDSVEIPVWACLPNGTPPDRAVFR